MDKSALLDYCRFCLKNLTNSDKTLVIDSSITRKFKDLTNNEIEIEESLAYSNIICVSCDKKLEDFYSFKRELIEKQRELQFRGNLLDEDSSSSIENTNLIRPISFNDRVKSEPENSVLPKKPINKNLISNTPRATDLIRPIVFNDRMKTVRPVKPESPKKNFSFPTIKVEPEFFNVDLTANDETDPFFPSKSYLFQSFLDESRAPTFEKIKKREIQCNFCDRSFPDNFKLRRHEKSHLGIKDYKCSACEKRYYRQEALNRHYRTVHLNLRFHCDVEGCINQYARKETYRHHVLTQHSDLGPEKVNELLLHIKNLPVPKVEHSLSIKTKEEESHIPTLFVPKIMLPLKTPITHST